MLSIMLDSGAFSAWNKKVAININEYLFFCLKWLDCFEYIVNLDVIPGTFGDKAPSDVEVERSAQKGYSNYCYLLANGIPKDKLIHVFHQGEKFDWLIKMVEEIPYIGLSPANDRTTSEKRAWLDDCMNYVLDDKGYPCVKFHGFGMTSLSLMLRYPWYSVDSTSWVLTGRFGSLFVPLRRNVKSIYDKQAWKVCVSSRSPKNKEEGQHFTTFTEMEQRVISDYFEEKGFTIGKSEIKKEPITYKLKEGENWFDKNTGEVEVVLEPGLCNDHNQRDEINIMYFLDLERSMTPWPWAFKRDKGMKGLGL